MWLGEVEYVLLVERDQELGTLKSLFADVMRGSGRVAVVSGGVASGKTELLRSVVEHSAESGAIHLNANGSSMEQGIPLGVLQQLLSRAPLKSEHAALVKKILANARKVDEVIDSSSRNSRQFPLNLVHDIAEILFDLAQSAPVLVTVDDIQYADFASLNCLRHLVDNLQGSRIMLVLTESTHSAPVHPVFHTETLRSRICRRVRLGTLSEAAVRAVTAEHLGTDAADRLTGDYFRCTGGNPLLVRALIDDVQTAIVATTTAAASVEFAPGHGFRQAVLACLERSEAQTLDVARAAAVLESSGALAAGSVADAKVLLRRVLDTDPATVDNALRVLDTMGVLGTGQALAFRHAAGRAAVLDDLDRNHRSHLHFRAAQLLHLEGAPAGRIATHLVAIGHAGSSWEVEVLLEAADQALADDDTENASRYLELAEAACVDDDHRTRIRAALARVEWRLNPGTALRYLTPLFEAFTRNQLSDADASTLLRYLLWHGRIDKAAEAIERTAHAERSRVGLQFGSACQLLVNSYPPLRQVVHRAQQLPVIEPFASANVSRCAQAAGALHSVLTDGPGNRVTENALQFLQRSKLTDNTVEAVESALLTLVYGERTDKAGPLCDELLEEATSRGIRTWQGVLSGVRAEIALRQGDLPAARRYAERALASIPRQSWGVAAGAPLATLALATLAMGEIDTAADQLEFHVPDSVFQSRFGLHYLQARGHYYLATDQLQAALADFQFCGALMREWGVDSPSFLPWRSDAAQVLLRLGEHEKAQELLTEQLDLTCAASHRARGISLFLLAQTKEVGKRVAVFRQAIDSLYAAGDRFMLSKAMHGLGQTYHTLNEPGKARMFKHRAEQLAKELRPEPPAEPRPEPDTASAAPAPRAEDKPHASEARVSSLTSSERRVAELAAHGYTNREISRHLYITVSTVEQHLTRVYRKLNVGSRAALPRELQLNMENTAAS
ncbi:helix-turn-helix transcriptional regulator [Allokutzneria oryzae]|uniref:AAA family ATPase n=1 Tax=Allokutzneria oryzae TaxID=1378989 RepID=A0ABV6A897_9PSEU